MLPKLSGIDVCRKLRERSEVPIIVVSAKSEEIDTVLLLEMGADDFVTKPYRLRELVARMRAVQRRRVSAEPRLDGGATVEAGGVRLEPETRRCYVRGTEVKLRRKEFELLHLLLANAGLVLTREVLIDRVWGSDYVGDTKTLDVHVKRLRALVEPDPKSPSLITTVRGVGLPLRRAEGDRLTAQQARAGPRPRRRGDRRRRRRSGRGRRAPRSSRRAGGRSRRRPRTPEPTRAPSR